MKYVFLSAIIVSAAAFFVHANNAMDDKSEKQPVELGTVEWLRDLDSAVAISKKDQKPIAVLFQEVPG
jgi:hypothetical protein